MKWHEIINNEEDNESNNENENEIIIMRWKMKIIIEWK